MGAFLDSIWTNSSGSRFGVVSGRGSGDDTRAMGGSVGGRDEMPEDGEDPSPGKDDEVVGRAVVPDVRVRFSYSSWRDPPCR